MAIVSNVSLGPSERKKLKNRVNKRRFAGGGLKGRTWTKFQDAEVLEQKVPDRELAKCFGRSVHVIRERRRKLRADLEVHERFQNQKKIKRLAEDFLSWRSLNSKQ
ncbi:hypothetical protein K2Q00_02520 [Patescibacteria group bacterium]|nr:hypothetical protein [Patescibacteria group bacterium]